jgi:ferrous iron transport protein B
LVGNPNTGKSTLFTALAGVHQRVGNYPGVTVEKKTGRWQHNGRRYELIDLPGLYSLAPRSRDEMVAVDALLGRDDESAVDAVLCVVDASNLERNLYLVSQVLELGLPTVLALNMVDVARDQGVMIDVAGLQSRLPIPVVPIQAHRGEGLAELKKALEDVVGHDIPRLRSPLPEPFERETEQWASLLTDGPAAWMRGNVSARFLAQRLLLDSNGYMTGAIFSGDHDSWNARLAASRQRLKEAGCVVPDVEISSRHDWARNLLEGAVIRPRVYRPTVTDRLDRFLTHRFWGMLVLVAVMGTVFQAVFLGAGPVTNLMSRVTEACGAWIESSMAEGALRSLLVDGVVRGAGAVLVFLPQIAILFCFIGILEDCGYMARAAYLMDKTMARVGLSGKSFLPMLSSFACAVPGIMGARVVENERDRLATILVAPLLTCSARLPVYTLMIAAFIPSRVLWGGLVSLQGLTLVGLYALGVVAAMVVARLLKRTLLRGNSPLFLMELPSYKWPSLRTIGLRVLERVWVFVRCAGTLILAVSVLTWAAMYYPQDAVSPEQKILGHAGKLIEPVVRPLGWDWRIGCAVVASFPAREVVVASLGVIFSAEEHSAAQAAGRAGSEADSPLQTALRTATWEGTDRPLFNVPVALSIMVFYALCAQCVATLAVIRRETNSWRWPSFTFGYMTILAYVGAFVTYQLGMWIGAL